MMSTKMIFLLLLLYTQFSNVQSQDSEMLQCIVGPPCECELDNPDVAEDESVNAITCQKQQLLEVPPLNTTGDMRTYQKIDYSRNSLNSIPDDYFNEVAGLEEIRLDFNAFVSIPKAIRILSGLKRLSIQDNRLNIFPSLEPQFVGLSSLEFLDLNKNAIETLYSGSFRGLISLDTLIVSSNKMSHIEQDVWKDLPTLKHINLFNNRLKSINDTYFLELNSLDTLNLTFNDIGYIMPNSFKDMGNLTSLELGFNLLKGYLQNDVFIGLPNLVRLDLGFNRISGLAPRVFDSFNKIESIDLHRNTIDDISIDNFGRSSYTLKTLFLGPSEIVMFPRGFFDHFPNLLTLSLLAVPITEVPDIRSLSKLEVLSLSLTEVTDIFPCDLEGLKNLTELYWYRSKINCNCDAKWLKIWYETMLSESHKSLIESSQRISWKCYSPPSLKGKAFHQIEASNLTCMGNREPKWCHGRYPSSLFAVKLSITNMGTSLELKWNISSNMIPRIAQIHIMVNADEVDALEAQLAIRYDVDKNATSYRLMDLAPDKLYNICLILSQENSIGLARDCIHSYSPNAEGKTVKSPKGIIIGSVISGLVFIMICALVMYFSCRKFRQNSAFETKSRLHDTDNIISDEARVEHPSGIVLFDPSQEETIFGVDA